MRIRTHILTLLSVSAFLVSNNTRVFGQDKTPKIRISEFYLQHGLIHQLPEHGTLSDFKNLAKGSSILNQDYTGFSDQHFGRGNNNRNSLLAIQLGIKFAKRPNPTLRLGVNYFSSSFINGSFVKDDSYVTDTLTSSQTGEQQYVLATETKSVRMKQTSQQFRIDAAFLFRTNSNARWSLYSGVGLTFGYAFNNKTHIQYEEYTFEPTVNDYYSTNTSSTYANEFYRNRNFATFSAYVPLGIDFRIGKKREFWNRLHLFGEFRPSLNYAKIPELKRILTPGSTQSFGLKVTF